MPDTVEARLGNFYAAPDGGVDATSSASRTPTRDEMVRFWDFAKARGKITVKYPGQGQKDDSLKKTWDDFKNNGETKQDFFKSLAGGQATTPAVESTSTAPTTPAVGSTSTAPTTTGGATGSPEPEHARTDPAYGDKFTHYDAKDAANAVEAVNKTLVPDVAAVTAAADTGAKEALASLKDVAVSTDVVDRDQVAADIARFLAGDKDYAQKSGQAAAQATAEAAQGALGLVPETDISEVRQKLDKAMKYWGSDETGNVIKDTLVLLANLADAHGSALQARGGVQSPTLLQKENEMKLASQQKANEVKSQTLGELEALNPKSRANIATTAGQSAANTGTAAGAVAAGAASKAAGAQVDIGQEVALMEPTLKSVITQENAAQYAELVSKMKGLPAEVKAEIATATNSANVEAVASLLKQYGEYEADLALEVAKMWVNLVNAASDAGMIVNPSATGLIPQ